MRLGITEEEFENEKGLKQDTMPFGEHKGKQIVNIPFDYLWWLYHEFLLYGGLKESVNEIFEEKMAKKVTCFGGYTEIHFEQEDICNTCELINKCKEIDSKHNKDEEDDWDERGYDEGDGPHWLTG